MKGDPSPEGTACWQWLVAGSFFVLIITASALAAWLLRERLTSQPVPTGSSSPRPDNALLRRGRLLYQVSCQGCHGAEGHGDGSAAAHLPSPPRDFAAGPWKFATSAAAVRKVIREGISGTSMPGSPGLGEADLDALTAFVLTLGPSQASLAENLRRVGLTPIDPPRPAPALDLLDLDGQPTSLARFRGSVVLIDFWATDCPHCLANMPELERVAKALGPRDGRPGLIVLPVCVNESEREEVRKAARPHVDHLTLFVDPRGLGKVRYDVQVLPSAFLVDPQGRLVGSATGKHAWSVPELTGLLRHFLE
jgi:mono/diheme cytochrome c family protein